MKGQELNSDQGRNSRGNEDVLKIFFMLFILIKLFVMYIVFNSYLSYWYYFFRKAEKRDFIIYE